MAVMKAGVEVVVQFHLFLSLELEEASDLHHIFAVLTPHRKKSIALGVHWTERWLNVAESRSGPGGREWNGSTIHLFPSCNLLKYILRYRGPKKRLYADFRFRSLDSEHDPLPRKET
jgi:hypothetical protein